MLKKKIIRLLSRFLPSSIYGRTIIVENVTNVLDGLIESMEQHDNIINNLIRENANKNSEKEVKKPDVGSNKQDMAYN